MKRVVAVVIALLVLAAGAFAWASRQAGLEVADAIARQQTFLGRQPWLRIAAQTYERGLFSSTATTTVEVRGPYGELLAGVLARATGSRGPVRLTQLLDIRHGPLPNWRRGDFAPARAVIETRLRLEGDLGERLPELFGADAPALVVTELVDADDGVAHLRVPAIARELSGGVRLAWQGLHGDIRFARSYDRMQPDLTMPGLELQGKDGKATLGAMSLKGDLRLGSHGLWLGTADARLAELSATGPGLALRATAGSYRTGVDAAGDFLDLKTDMAAQGVEFQGEKAGPFRLAMSARHLHGPTVKALRDAAEALQARNPTPREEALEQIALTRRFFGDLMRRQPEFRVDDLSFRMPAGDLRLTLSLRVVRYDDEAGANPFSALEGIEGDLDLDLAEPLALALGEKALARRGAWPGAAAGEAPDAAAAARSAASDQINALVLQGHLVRDGERLKAAARWRDGALKVNGFPVAVPFGRPPEPARPAIELPPPDLPPPPPRTLPGR
ncbi:MAG: YdgA family protein [Rhodocyclaceae bacterium]|nr:YdgA family protein [Rhodocyclaceae bacterium]